MISLGVDREIITNFKIKFVLKHDIQNISTPAYLYTFFFHFLLVIYFSIQQINYVNILKYYYSLINFCGPTERTLGRRSYFKYHFIC